MKGDDREEGWDNEKYERDRDGWKGREDEGRLE